jgi:MFS family permease
LSGSKRWLIIVLVSAGSSIIYTPAYLKGVFYKQLMEALGVTNAQLGALLSAYAITALITYLPSGIIADKIHCRTLSAVGFFGTAVFTAWYAMLPSYPVLMVIMVGMGITSICIWWGVRFKLVRLVCSEDEYPKKIGYSYAFYGLAGLVLGFLNLWLVSLFVDTANGVRFMLWFLAAIIALLGVLSLIFIPHFIGELDPNAKMLSLNEFFRAVKNPAVVWTALSVFFIYFVYMGAQYTTPFLSDAGIATVGIVTVISLIRQYGVTLLSSPIMGTLAEKVKSSSKVIIACFVIGIVIIAGLNFLPWKPSLAILMAVLVVLIGFIMNGAFGIASAQLTEAKVPLPIFGAATGILSIIGFLPDTFQSTWFGHLIDVNGAEAYHQIFYILGVAAILGIFATYMVFRSGAKSAAAAQTDLAETPA